MAREMQGHTYLEDVHRMFYKAKLRGSATLKMLMRLKSAVEAGTC